MFRHGPSCLGGPVSRALDRWSAENPPATKADYFHEPTTSRDPSVPVPQIRTELVERVRRAIAEGRYETPEKWQAALELLFRHLQDS